MPEYLVHYYTGIYHVADKLAEHTIPPYDTLDEGEIELETLDEVYEWLTLNGMTRLDRDPGWFENTDIFEHSTGGLAHYTARVECPPGKWAALRLRISPAYNPTGWRPPQLGKLRIDDGVLQHRTATGWVKVGQDVRPLEWCREWLDDKADNCNQLADLILWGKLFPPEALGPRCLVHAVKHIGWEGMRRPDQYAVFDLRPLQQLAQTAKAWTEGAPNAVKLPEPGLPYDFDRLRQLEQDLADAVHALITHSSLTGQTSTHVDGNQRDAPPGV